VWEQKTVEFAISVTWLMRLMNATGDVELHSPAREFPGCGGAEEVLVVPEGLCGDCWSRKAIAAWRVMPMSFEGLRIGNRNKK